MNNDARRVRNIDPSLEKWISDIRFNIIGSLSEIWEYSKEYGK